MATTVKYFFCSEFPDIPEKSRRGKKQIVRQLQSVILNNQTQLIKLVCFYFPTDEGRNSFEIHLLIINSAKNAWGITKICPVKPSRDRQKINFSYNNE